MKKTIHDKYKSNFFKSNDMEDLYQNYPDPWRHSVDGHDRYRQTIETLKMNYPEDSKIVICDIGCGEGVFSNMLKDAFFKCFSLWFRYIKNSSYKSYRKI